MTRLAVLGLLLCTATPAAAQLALPVHLPSATLSSASDVLVYTIDLDTLPARPRIVVDVDPGPARADVQLEIELTNFVPDPGTFGFSIGCPLSFTGGTGSWFSDPATGPARLEADLFFCHPSLSTWDGIDAEVRVRALDLGAGGAPLAVSVTIEGITWVPNQLLLQQVIGPQTVTAVASQDTVIYGDDHDASNGAGDYLWVGTRVVPFLGAPGVYFRYPRRSLLRFDGLSVSVPPNAIVTSASLDVFATGLAGFAISSDLFAVAPGPGWFAGSANAAGDEFFGVTGSSSSVDWIDRTFSQPWLSPGGDTATPSPLVSNVITAVGPHGFDSPGLAAAVQDMVDTDDFGDGLLLSTPSAGFVTSGVQLASANHPDPALRPTLSVSFDQSEPYFEGYIDPDLVDFLNEGEDFRWIYDGDLDGILVTEIGGICETTPPPAPPLFTHPYSYSYAGAPGYVGTDCCTWRIYSEESETVGTGQALFFHNLDPLDPANLPADSDGDGILDGCDSCQYVANGPLLGSCMTAGGVNTGPCQSDLECAAGESCDLSQLDDDGDGVGNACPEPGLGAGLALASLGLAAGARRRGARAAPIGGSGRRAVRV